MSRFSTAFLKGGFGCLGAFIAFGLLCVLLGGTMKIDFGGAIVLLISGGVLGAARMVRGSEHLRENS